MHKEDPIFSRGSILNRAETPRLWNSPTWECLFASGPLLNKPPRSWWKPLLIQSKTSSGQKGHGPNLLGLISWFGGTYFSHAPSYGWIRTSKIPIHLELPSHKSRFHKKMLETAGQTSEIKGWPSAIVSWKGYIYSTKRWYLCDSSKPTQQGV